MAIYVDDNLIVGHTEAIDDTIDLLKQNGFILKVEDDLKDYLSYEIVFSTTTKKAWQGQPHLLANLQKIGKVVGHLMSTKTPGTPNFRIVLAIQTIGGAFLALYYMFMEYPSVGDPKLNMV